MIRKQLLFILSAALLLLAGACSDTRVPEGSAHVMGKEWLISGAPSSHGGSAINCSECHDKAVFCFGCHFGSQGASAPAGSAWQHGTYPHNLPELVSAGETCDACHTVTSFYARRPEKCHNCHEAPPLPHAMGAAWLSRLSSQFHGRHDVLNLPLCTQCHEIQVFCAECHFGPEGAKVPPESGWTHGRAGHTDAPVAAFDTVCVKCHELTIAFGYGPVNKTCTNCHNGSFAGHQLPFQLQHGAEAKASLKACQVCHGRPGTSFEGGVASLACSSCHTAASAHPTDWQGLGASSHRTAGDLPNSCALCHDVQMGRTPPLAAAPSCFSANFTNADGAGRSCHPGGFASHPLPFAAPALHGEPAKNDLALCQNCHGVPGSTQFSGGSSNQACSACHPDAGAHPTDWQGSGSYSHRTAGNTGTACALCHDVSQGRAAPDVNAPSCFSATFQNGAGQARSCHSGGPGLPHAAANIFSQPANHGQEAKKDMAYCQGCHGLPGTTRFDGGSAPSCTRCHAPARAHPTNWQGSGAYSHRSAVNSSSTCVLCHKVDGPGAGLLAGAPSCFSATFTNAAGSNTSCHSGGPGIPHAAPAQFRLAAAHGPVAKADLTYCQKCHGRPGTTEFSGGNATACTTCHAPARAHATNWQGSGAYSHRNSGNQAAACSLCHDYTQNRQAPLPASPSCYAANFTNNLGQARACHPGGPLGHPQGQLWLDKKSAQFHGDSSLTCANCHTVATLCSECHFGPSGSRTPPGTGWTHGRSSHDNYEQYQTVCNSCHNVNRQYGNAPGNCHNCHDD